LEQREISLAFERSQSLPQLDLVASYGLNGLDTSFGGSWDQVSDGDTDSYSVGAVVSIPLPNRTASARRQAAALRVQRSLLELKDLESRIAVQLYNASGQIETSRERVDVARMARDLADRNLKAEEKLLQNGASSTFLVLDQQERLSQAQLDELSALVSLNNAVASYERLAGRTDYDATAERLLAAEEVP
jgi:outer membrane protein TolC